MKTTLLFLLFCFSGLVAGQAPEIIHVSSQAGSVETGSISQPFGSLSKAIGYMRGRRIQGQKQGQVEIWLHDGHYPLTGSIVLDENDSGEEGAPLIIRSAPGERASLFGGTVIPSGWFQPLSDTTFLSRLVSKQAGSKILVADLVSHGVSDYGWLSRHGWSMEPEDRIPPASLSVGGKRMILARWPNPDVESPYMIYQHYLPEPRALRGYELKMQSIIDVVKLPGDVTYTEVIDPGEKFSLSGNYQGKGGTIRVPFDRMKYWGEINDIYLDGVLSSTWEWTYNNLESVDVEEKTITLASPELHGLGIGESVRLAHFHFQNVPEEIDIPGEYYIDRAKGLLYLYPPEGYETMPIVLSTLDQPMLVLRGVRHVQFRGLTFDSGRNLGFLIRGCDHILVDQCEIGNFTLGGIDIYGTDNQIRDSRIYGMGGFGIHLDGGDFESLEPGNNKVINCQIHDFGWDQKSQLPGVIIDGVGQRVAHCEIFDGPHFAIRMRLTNDVVVEYNEIHDLPKYHMFDGGSIYVFSGSRPESRGNEIRYNYFHDIPTIGIYPDNYTWGTQIFGNVFEKVGVLTGRAAVHVNGGGECRTFNNLIIECAQLYGQGARPKDSRWFTYWDETLEKFGDGKVDRTPYSKYPDFKQWLSKTRPEEFLRPASYVYSNLFFHPT